MPHAVLSFSSDLNLDAAAILRSIEDTILMHDSGAGHCKGRAYPAGVYRHSHVMVDISLLNKPHRDSAFMQNLSDALEAAIKAHLALPCAFSMELRFSGPNYVTNMHHGA